MKPLDRRTMLKGMLGGAVVSVALPPLAAMMNSNGTAYAGNSSFPKRFGVFFWGNGVLPKDFIPGSEGAGFSGSSILDPLLAFTEVRNRLLVVSGTRVATINTAPHEAGPAGLLTGDSPRKGTYTRATIDQVIAENGGSETRFRSLEIGVQQGSRSLSHSGPGLMNPIESDPVVLFRRLFRDGFRAPGSTGAPDPKLALDQSVLDAVSQQAKRLSMRLGSEDRRKLSEHLEGIAIMERQIKRAQENPPALVACAPPGEPSPIADIAGRPDMRERSRLMSDLVAMALACDQTRVFFNMYTQPVNNTLFGNAPAGHHQLTHDEAGDQPIVRGILQLIMHDFGYFLSALARVNEGDTTLLDNTLVLGTTDCSYGRNHALDEYPIILAGGANLGFKQNYHLRARDENASKLSLAILQSFGVRARDFGVDDGYVSDPLSGVLA